MGSTIGKLFGGGKSTPGTQTVQSNPITAFAQPFYTDYFNRAQQMSQDPSQFTPAAFTPEQEAALSSLALPSTNPEAYAAEIQQYQNPYDQQVINEVLKELSRQNEGILTNISQRASAAGGFGGTRQAVLEGEAYRNLMDVSGQQVAGLRSQGYREALANRRQGILDTLTAGSMRQEQQQSINDADLNALNYLGQALQIMPQGGGTTTTTGTASKYKPSALEMIMGVSKGAGDLLGGLFTGGSSGGGGYYRSNPWRNPDTGQMHY